MPPPLHRWSAVRLARALARRTLNSAALAEALIERSAAREPDLQAWASFEPAAVRRRACAVDTGSVAGALRGLAIAVKDNIDTAGIETAQGSPIHAGQVPLADAACVALARSAGAWVLGKTVAAELANMTPGPTRNPHHLSHTPGGSSSGSAAAVAAGMAPLALGTQTAGSVIRPAAFCGIVGYKPSPGRVPRAGVKPVSDTLDEIGVLARSVDDAALLAHALEGRDGAALPSAAAFKPRLALTMTPQAAALSGAMQTMLGTAAQRLSAAGAAVGDLPPWPAAFAALFEAQRCVQLFETARALALEHRCRRGDLSAALAAFLDEGAALDPARYAQARIAAAHARATLDALFGDAELLLAPAACGAAPQGLSSTGDPLFSRPWQLLGCPCLTLPGAVDRHGLPLGLQLVARPQHDDRLFAAAAWVAQTLDADAIAQGRSLD
jgi:amidase